jgi:hypothetical protein
MPKQKKSPQYGQLRETKSQNEVDKLLAQPRTIPTSCVQDRDTTLTTFSPCNPNDIHSHSEWFYHCSAWNTVQEKGHVGTGGECLGLEVTKKWEYVLNFYNKHKLAAFCSITAERINTIYPQKWMEKNSVVDTVYTTGESQYVKLYIKCDGCECNTDNFEDWIQHGQPSNDCTNQFGKPQFLK